MFQLPECFCQSFCYGKSCKAEDQKKDGKTYYSAWSKVKSVKTKQSSRAALKVMKVPA